MSKYEICRFISLSQVCEHRQNIQQDYKYKEYELLLQSTLLMIHCCERLLKTWNSRQTLNTISLFSKENSLTVFLGMTEYPYQLN